MLWAIEVIASNIFEIVDVNSSNIVWPDVDNESFSVWMLSSTLSDTLTKLSDKVINLPYSSCPDSLDLSIDFNKSLKASFDVGIAIPRLLKLSTNWLVLYDNCSLSVKIPSKKALNPDCKSLIEPAPLIIDEDSACESSPRNINLSLSSSSDV